MERAGINAVDDACNALDLIWRDLLQEDVGLDGTIEIAIGDFPSGKLVGAQVKSGRSYMRSETDTSFRFYPGADDLVYWSQLSIPMFLFVHDPQDRSIYWVDVTRHVQQRAQDPLGEAYIEFCKSDVLDASFEAYLKGLFDLAIYDDAQFAAARAELEALKHTNGEGAGIVTVDALDLFVEGLWGLCSKLQFHSSLLADIIRKSVRERGADIRVRYTFSRSALYPFFIAYFAILSKHHLATIDAADVNESLYAKLEFPTFIAPLTTNGRRFVEYLRRSGETRAHDNRFFTLSLIPHEQIEIYDSFTPRENGPVFGRYTDVLGISFNPHLDYYHLIHWQRAEFHAPAQKVADQNITFFELTDYIERRFGATDKDNILLRHLELPLTPLICWLEDWYQSEQPFSPDQLAGKSNVATYGFHDELSSIMSAAGALTLSEPQAPALPLRQLFNGEVLEI